MTVGEATSEVRALLALKWRWMPLREAVVFASPELVSSYNRWTRSAYEPIVLIDPKLTGTEMRLEWRP